jgi:hypothetical protein
VEDRRVLDDEMCADITKLDGMGDARVVAAVSARLAVPQNDRAGIEAALEALEYQRDVKLVSPVPHHVRDSAASGRAGRRVYAALKRSADTTFDDRSRGQVMADTLVERVTGRPAMPRNR